MLLRVHVCTLRMFLASVRFGAGAQACARARARTHAVRRRRHVSYTYISVDATTLAWRWSMSCHTGLTAANIYTLMLAHIREFIVHVLSSARPESGFFLGGGR